VSPFIEMYSDAELVEEVRSGVLDAGLVLNATGRIPNADALGAGALFDTHDDGRLATDARMRVLAGGEPVDGVYALGDVTSAHQLKHVANQQARVVRDNLRGLATEDLLAPIPQAIFGHPEVASFGTRGQDAPADAVVVDRAYSSTAYGWAMEDESSFARLVVGRDGGTLLGLMLSSKNHDGDRDWLAVGSGPWDAQGRPSWLRLDRVLDVPEAGIRREGAIFPREKFDTVASRLKSDFAWH